MRFTVEEMRLIQALNHACRRMLIFEIRASLPDMEDRELKELCEKTLQKVVAMSEEEFAAIDFTVDEEEETNE